MRHDDWASYGTSIYSYTLFVSRAGGDEGLKLRQHVRVSYIWYKMMCFSVVALAIVHGLDEYIKVVVSKLSI